jgi:hypothetical protein
MAHARVTIAAPRRLRGRGRPSAGRTGSPSRVRAVLRFGGRAFRAWCRLSALGRTVTAVAVLTPLSFGVNGAYQVLRKPTELFFPVSGTLSKTPPETWRSYASLFREDATATMTPELLAALAQVEGAGNPVARTYWQWHPSWNPFEWYRPASSAVGMYQITDGTFALARRYCIHDHVVAEVGRWDDVHACWFNALYTRVIPSHAVEMTAALLDLEVAHVTQRLHLPSVSVERRENLAAVIHLCGEGGGDVYARNGFLAHGLRCGDQDVGRYVANVNAMKREFAILSRER